MQVEKIHFSYNMDRNLDKPENALRKEMHRVPKLPKIAANARFIGVRFRVSGSGGSRFWIQSSEVEKFSPLGVLKRQP